MKIRNMLNFFCINLLALIILLVISPGIYAEDSIVTIKNSDTGLEYTTLQEAIDNVEDGQTIEILSDNEGNILYENIESFEKSYTLDFHGNILDGSKRLYEDKGSVFVIYDGTVTLRDGTLQGGFTNFERTPNYTYDKGDFHIGGSGLLISGSGTNNNIKTDVTLEGMTITKNVGLYGAGVLLEKAKLTIKESTNTGKESIITGNTCIDSNSSQGGAIWERGTNTEVYIQNSTISGNKASNGAALYMSNHVEAVNTHFINNVGNDSGSQRAILYLDSTNLGTGKKSNCSFENCTFIGNTGAPCTIYSNMYESKFTNCEISGNKAYQTGGIYYYGGTLNLTDTVIRDNTVEYSTTNTYTNVSGGLTVASLNANFISGAIYNNTSKSGASDIFILSGSQRFKSFIEASEMKDNTEGFQDYNFEYYKWMIEDQNPINRKFVTKGDILKSQSSSLNLAAVNAPETNVAQIGDNNYKTLADAISAVENEQTIKLIVGEENESQSVITQFNTEPIIIDNKKITIDLNGKDILPQTIADKSNIFTIKSGASLSLEGSGTVSGTINLNDTSSLTLNCGSKQDLTIKKGSEDSIINIGPDFSIGNNNLIVSLPESVLDKLRGFDEFEYTLINNCSLDFDLNKIILLELNNPQIQIYQNGSSIKVKVVPLLETNSIFVSSKQGNNANDGSKTAPLQSISEAINKLNESEKETGTIYVLDTYKVSGTEDWINEKEKQEITIKRFYDENSYNLNYANLIEVPGNAKLNITNITVDGNTKETANTDPNLVPLNAGSIIRTETRSTLILNKGTILTNNRKAGKSDTPYLYGGGAISANGDVEINGAVISNCEAYSGGAIFISSAKLTIKWGEIHNNRALGELIQEPTRSNPNGGAILLDSGATMTMEDGSIIYNNFSDGDGGAISLGRGYSFFHSPYKSDDETYDFTMNGGVIYGNSSALTGGGLFIQATYKALIKAGTFNDNTSCVERQSHSSNILAAAYPHFGGGAIYVNGENGIVNGKVVIENLELTQNKSEKEGGGIAVCHTGYTSIANKTSAIYNNQSKYNSDDYTKDDLALTSYDGVKSVDIFQDSRDCTIEDSISLTMIDGTPYEWRRFKTNNQIGALATQEYLKGTHGKHLYNGKTELKERDDLTTYIINNTSKTRGGGIGSNGDVIIGKLEEPLEKITVQKKWKNNEDNELNFEEIRQNFTNVNIWLYGHSQDENIPDYYIYNSLFRKNYNEHEDQWFNEVSFDKYTGYTYSFVEEIVLKNGKRVIYSPDDSINISVIIEEIKKVNNLNDDDIILPENSPFVMNFEGETNNFTLTNKIETGDLNFSKKVEIRDNKTKVDPENKYQFKVTLTNNFGLLKDTYEYKKIDSNSEVSTGNLTFTEGISEDISLKAGESITIKDLPLNTSYKIEELGENAHYQDRNLEGKITKEIPFENVITITNVFGSRVGSLEIPVTKTIYGTPEEKGLFKFALLPVEEYSEDQLLLPRDLEILGSGTKKFDNITFFKPGDYSFIIEEIKNIDGYICDTSYYKLNVNVIEDPNDLLGLIIDWENSSLIKVSGNEETEIEFNSLTTLEFFNTLVTEEPSVKKEEVRINDDNYLSQDDFDLANGQVVGPYVDINDIVTYNISWNNVSSTEKELTVIDRLDDGVDFYSASYNNVNLTADTKVIDNDKVSITYDESSHTVTWLIKNPSSEGYVTLRVKVNEKANQLWSYDINDPTVPNSTNDSEKQDHQIVNQAKVIIDNKSLITEKITNPLVGLFIEKIHVTVSTQELKDKYIPDIFEDGGDYDLPKGADYKYDGHGFTEVLDLDTEENDYKKTFTHDPGNTVRYYLKVTNNYPEDLEHVIIMDPVRINSVQETNTNQTIFKGIAGTINNKPNTEGRTQQYVNVEPISISKDDIVTYKLVSLWDKSWGSADITIEYTKSIDSDFIAAYYKDTNEDNYNEEENDGHFSLSYSDFLEGKTEATGTENYQDTTISYNGQTISWNYHIDEGDSEDDNIMYLQLHIPGANQLDINSDKEKLNLGTYGGLIKNNITPSDNTGSTNDIVAIFNPDDINGDETIEQNEGYIRWELDKLPGRNKADGAELNEDGYAPNVQIVYFCWDIPEGVEEYTSWKNTAYVQTMADLQTYLSENYSDKYKEYLDNLSSYEEMIKEESTVEEDESESDLPNTEVPKEDLYDYNHNFIETINSYNTKPLNLFNSFGIKVLDLEDLEQNDIAEIINEDEEVESDNYEVSDEVIENSETSDEESPTDNGDTESSNDPEDSTETPVDENPNVSMDNSNTNHVSIFSTFSWSDMIGGMMKSNTVREQINSGSVEISKKVNSSNTKEGEFTFKIDLSFHNFRDKEDVYQQLNNDVYPIKDNNGKILGYIENQSGTFTLKDGESIRIENLPLRTEFTITEDNNTDYVVTGNVTYPSDQEYLDVHFGGDVKNYDFTGSVAKGVISTNNSTVLVSFVNTEKTTTPDKPTTPENPNTPDRPTQPNNPSTPNTPTNPSEPEVPEEPDATEEEIQPTPENPEEPSEIVDEPNETPEEPNETPDEPNVDKPNNPSETPNNSNITSPENPDVSENPSNEEVQANSSQNTTTTTPTVTKTSTTEVTGSPKTGISELGLIPFIISLGTASSTLLFVRRKRKK